jgi:hypothetical protein
MPVVIALLLLAFAAPARAAGAPVHHVLELHLDPATRTLRGVDRVTLAPHAPLTFTLSPGFVLVRVRADTHEIRSTDTRGQYALPLDAATAHDVVVEYRATLGSASGADELTGPVASPAGSCLPGTGWFPSFDGPFTYEITIDVPEPQRAVTSGRLTAETTDGRRSRSCRCSRVRIVSPSACIVDGGCGRTSTSRSRISPTATSTACSAISISTTAGSAPIRTRASRWSRGHSPWGWAFPA